METHTLSAARVRARQGAAARVRFAVAGLLLALALGIAVPLIARAFPVGVQAATFAIASLFFVALGYAIGGRVDTLEQRSLEDPVTHVGNRRRWEQAVAEEVARAVRSRMPLSLLVLDVDHLKRLNDANGHKCGDRALTVLGDVLLDTCRSRDVAARFGGDEFVVLLPRTRASEATVVAERVRAELARRRAAHAELDPALTVSIGIADLDAVSAPRGELLFEAADRALYAAKGGGRDRIVVADRERDRERPRSSGVIRLDEARLRRRPAR